MEDCLTEKMHKMNFVFKDYLRDYQRLHSYGGEAGDGHWSYEDGCLMLGAERMYELTGESIYFDFIEKMVSSFIDEDGRIVTYSLLDYNLDFINSGKVLYFLYDKTGKEMYQKAIKMLARQLEYQPRLIMGNFWHKLIYPFQVWLDGLYMALPFYLEYEKRYKKQPDYTDIIRQFQTVRSTLYDENTGLYYHAFNENRERSWADKETGCSPNFWLRAIGWLLMAMLDCYELLGEGQEENQAFLAGLFQEAISGVMNYQNQESKMFYQMISLPEESNNYLETSGTLMVGYSLLKACRLGILNKDSDRTAGKEIVEAVVEKQMREENGRLHLYGTCRGAGLGPQDQRDGSAAYYLSEPIITDDPKGFGVLMMAWDEYKRAK